MSVSLRLYDNLIPGEGKPTKLRRDDLIMIRRSDGRITVSRHDAGSLSWTYKGRDGGKKIDSRNDRFQILFIEAGSKVETWESLFAMVGACTGLIIKRDKTSRVGDDIYLFFSVN